MATGGEIEQYHGGMLASYDGAAPSIKRAMDTIMSVKHFVAENLKEETDYGVIPGTEKPALYQPGAQKICMLFDGRFERVRDTIEYGNGHVEHIVTSKIVSRNSGTVLAEGIGSASTLEDRYRYRKAARLCPQCGKDAIIKGKEEYGGGWVCFDKKGGCKAKFKDGDRSIEGQVVGQVEVESGHNSRNTVLKMSVKRADVAAAIALGGVSDLYTQDVEDGHDDSDRPSRKPAPADSRPTNEKVKERRAEDDRQRSAKAAVNEEFKPAQQQAWTVSQFAAWVDKAVEGGNKWWRKKAGDEWESMTKAQQTPFNPFRIVGHLCKWFGGYPQEGIIGQAKGFEGLIGESIDRKHEILAAQFPAWKGPFETELKQYMQRDVPEQIREELKKKAEKAAARVEPVATAAEVAEVDNSSADDNETDDAWDEGRE